MAAGSTTCGVVLKTLVKAPIYCDGSSVVVLVPLPGGGAGASTRSLFGSGGSISSLRCEYESCAFGKAVQGGFWPAGKIMQVFGMMSAREATLLFVEKTCNVGIYFDFNILTTVQGRLGYFSEMMLM